MLGDPPRGLPASARRSERLNHETRVFVAGHLGMVGAALLRRLVLLTKIVQALANGTRFNEAYMQKINGFLDENAGDRRAYLARASSVHDEQLERLESIELPEVVERNSLARVARYIASNREQLIKFVSDDTLKQFLQQVQGVRELE